MLGDHADRQSRNQAYDGCPKNAHGRVVESIEFPFFRKDFRDEEIRTDHHYYGGSEFSHVECLLWISAIFDPYPESPENGGANSYSPQEQGQYDRRVTVQGARVANGGYESGSQNHGGNHGSNV